MVRAGGEQLFRGLLEAAPDAMVIVGQDGRIALVNAQTENLFGYDRSELVGQPVEVLVPDAVRGKHEHHRAAFSRHASPRPMGASLELHGRRRDGSTFPVEISLAPLDTSDGTYVSAAVRDVTERRRVTQALAESEARLAALVANSSEMILVISPEGGVTYANPAAAEALGGDSLPEGSTLFDLVHPDDLERALGNQRAHVEGVAGEWTQYRVRYGDGTWHDVEGISTNLLDDPSVRGIVVNVHDISDRVRSAKLRAAQREVLLRIATGEPLEDCLRAVGDLVREQLPDAVVQVAVAAHGTADVQVVVVVGDVGSKLAAAQCAHVVAEAVRARSAARVTFPDEDGSRHRASTAVPLLTRTEGDLLGVLTVCVPDAGLLPLLGQDVLDVAQSLAQIALDRQGHLDRLLEMALHDELTGLPNRALFFDRLRQCLQAERRNGRLTAVLFCDLDNFKLVNDTLGHSVGDQLLRDVGTRIQHLLRPGDTVARFGGDEFVVLATDLHSEEEVIFVAERLVRAVREPMVVGGADRVVTVSVGAAVASPLDDDPETVLSHADTALYRAKALGRDRAEVFDADLQQLAHDRLDLESALRAAVHAEQLQLHYQPQVDVATGEVTCVEALVRWHRPGVGLVPADVFVPLAEETGLIGALGDWVLRAACQQAAQWALSGRPLALSVNVSARQLSRTDIVAVVQQALASSGLAPHRLRLELTETVIMDDVELANVTLMRLTDLGVTISIDDFGTGYSSLLYLKRLPVSELKVDSAFVQGLGTDPEDETIVKGIVQLAQALGLTTVAEGVETEDQLAHVRRLGCTAAQGYLVSRPLPAPELWAWLTESAPLVVPVPRQPSSVFGAPS